MCDTTQIDSAAGLPDFFRMVEFFRLPFQIGTPTLCHSELARSGTNIQPPVVYIVAILDDIDIYALLGQLGVREAGESLQVLKRELRFAKYQLGRCWYAMQNRLDEEVFLYSLQQLCKTIRQYILVLASGWQLGE
jgi:hypothetical protein